ncbi:MAG: hypothetical protein HYU64_18985 [Armatimonadetes bacterium]|nr:hypothetical protein [Armatimonadota bacterium]
MTRITLLLIALALLGAFGFAAPPRSDLSLYFYLDSHLYYPGEGGTLSGNVSLRDSSTETTSLPVAFALYPWAPAEGDKSPEQYLKRVKPLAAWKETVMLTGGRRSWQYGQITSKIPPQEAGEYLIVATAEDARAYQMFRVSRLSLLAKASEQEVLVFAQDLRTGAPLSGVSLSWIFSGEKKLSKETTTNRKGLSSWTASALDLLQLPSPIHITGKFEGSDAFLDIYPRAGGQRLKGYIYTDRPIYRPSQTVHFKGILRLAERDALVPLKETECMVTIRDSKGGEFYKKTQNTNTVGSLWGEATLGEEPPLGDYVIEVKTKNQSAQGRFRVEEYRKPEYEVLVTSPRKHWLSGDELEFEVQAKYYFGAPVAMGEFRYDVTRSPVYRYYRWWEGDYHSHGSGGEHVTSGEGKTDVSGRAAVSIKTQKETEDFTYTVTVRMVDPSRREVTGSHTVRVTRGSFTLQAECDKTVYRKDQEARISIRARDHEDRPVSTRVKAVLVRKVYEKESTTSEEIAVQELTTDSTGIARGTFSLPREGDYEIHAKALDEREREITASTYFWVAGAGYRGYRGTSIEMIPDKKTYQPGDTAQILLNLPFDGAGILLTVEGREIFSKEVLEPQGSSASLEIPIEESYSPGVQVVVSSVQGKSLHRKSVNLAVKSDRTLLSVHLKADKDHYEPRQTVRYRLRAVNPAGKPELAELSLGVADESVYALWAGGLDPIHLFFYEKMEHLVNTDSSLSQQRWDRMRFRDGGRDMVQSAIPTPPPQPSEVPKGAMKKAKANGDEGGYKQPEFVRSYFPDTAYFNPGILTDESGEAVVSFALPDSLTTWRATAKGVTPERAGEAESKITVSKRLLLRLEAPRFAVERDELLVSAVVHNYLAQDKRVKVTLKASGLKLESGNEKTYFPESLLRLYTASGLKLESGNEKTVHVPANGSARVDWKVKAGKPMTARLSATALSDEVSDAVEIPFPVLPHGAMRFAATSGDTRQSAMEKLTLPKDALDAASLRVTMSPSLAGSMLGALEYLAGYPYGCVEQTMSRFLPTVIVSRTLQDQDITIEKLQGEIPKMVKKGLDRLYNFHHSDGGWGWWEHDESHPNMTAYVVYGLSLAEKAGFSVDRRKIEAGAGWLKSHYEKQEPDIQAYMLFALSEAGEKEPQRARELFKGDGKLNSYSRALLARALARWGLKDEALALTAKLESQGHSTGTSVSWSGKKGSYSWTDNDVEATAQVLQALLAIKPESPLIAKGMRYLVLSRRGEGWYSTKDTAAAVLALNEYLKHSPELHPDFQAELRVNGTVVATRYFTGKDTGKGEAEFVIPSKHLKEGENEISFRMSGKGKLYYTAYLRYYSREEGIAAQPGGLRVEREYKKIDGGKEVPLSSRMSLKSGDVLVVTITVSTDRNYEYIQIEDPKPAGCEVLDPFEQRHYGRWSWWYAHREVRDSKVAYFATRFWKGKQSFTYRMRAETPGVFHVMPARASLMYLPEVGGSCEEAEMTIRD